MLQIEHARPHPQLSGLIRAFVQRDFAMRGAGSVEPVVARLGMMLEFQFRDPYYIPSFADDSENHCAPVTIIGPITQRRVRLIVRGNVSALAVIFEPAGFSQLFGVPASTFAERGTEGHAVLGPGVSELHEHLGNACVFNERVDLLNSFFLARTRRLAENHRVLQGLRTLLRPATRHQIAQLSQQSGLSARQLERKSQEYFGVSPVMLARISRFQRALTSGSRRNTSWLQIAHASDYYDQMHMIRDFRTFAGSAPNEALASIAPHHLIHFQ